MFSALMRTHRAGRAIVKPIRRSGHLYGLCELDNDFEPFAPPFRLVGVEDSTLHACFEDAELRGGFFLQTLLCWNSFLRGAAACCGALGRRVSKSVGT